MWKKHVNWKVLIRSLICITFAVLLFNSNIAYAGPWYGYADVVLDYYDSGTGSMAGPYGGTSGTCPTSVSTDAVIGEPDSYFLSLPTGSYVTVGFIDETIINGTGDDIFITEYGYADDRADVYISSNLTDFTLLGTASDDGTTSKFNLADIGYTDPVIAIKIVGLDDNGSTEGFDLCHIQVALGSIGPPTYIDASFICKHSSGNNVAIFDVYGNLFLKGGLTTVTTPAVSANDEFVILGSSNDEVAIIDLLTGDMVIDSFLFVPTNEWTSQTNMNEYSENFIIRDSSGNVKANIDSYGRMFLMGKVYEYYLP
ncbi:MAG: hypothetical protein JXA96_16895 [Sedimentisphaerales bacterium]|nr:hypothetical protein [Sedimentisphaerales bacterium]